jgi:hypothetical protein
VPPTFAFSGLLLAEHILAHTAQGALEILGDFLPLGTGGNATLRIALSFVVDPAANIANILHNDFLLEINVVLVYHGI